MRYCELDGPHGAPRKGRTTWPGTRARRSGPHRGQASGAWQGWGCLPPFPWRGRVPKKWGERRCRARGPGGAVPPGPGERCLAGVGGVPPLFLVQSGCYSSIVMVSKGYPRRYRDGMNRHETGHPRCAHGWHFLV